MKTNLSLRSFKALALHLAPCFANRSIAKVGALYLLLALCSEPSALSQVPQGFNYQAVARDESKNPVTVPISVRFTIQSDSLGGTVFWVEEHLQVTPDKNGALNLVIGRGIRVSGLPKFSDIDWTVKPKFIMTHINHEGWKLMGSTRLWAVPYAMVADSLGGPLTKLSVKGVTTNMEEALFEVKNTAGKTVFAVYNEGVRVYVADGDAKGVKGGFAVGSMADTKEEDHNYLYVSGDSIRAYVFDDPESKIPKGGFAVTGFDYTKKQTNDYLLVSPDSVRVYIDKAPSTKAPKGGFAVSGFDYTKAVDEEYLRVTRDSTRIYINDQAGKAYKGGFAVSGFGNAKGAANFFNVATDATDIIDPGQNRILWYPIKNAFLAGKVRIGTPDSVGENSFATGYQSKARGMYSQAMGYKAIANGDYSTAIGKDAIAMRINSLALGENAQAIKEESYAIGRGAIAEGFRSFAFGSAGIDSAGQKTGVAFAIGDYSFAIGQGSQSLGTGCFAIGIADTAAGFFSTAIGYKTKASWGYSTSMGRETKAEGYISTAIGERTTASGTGSTALGGYTIASGGYSTALGFESNAIGAFSVAMGLRAIASTGSSIAIGDKTIASGASSLALVKESVASGAQSVAIGYKDTASGRFSTAIGRETKAIGDYSTAIGLYTKAFGYGSTATGESSEAKGLRSTAMGFNAVASGDYSAAIGRSYAIGFQSTAMGGSMANGYGSTALGQSTTSNGDYSTSMGVATYAYSAYETVMGRYNTSYSPTSLIDWVPSDRLFVVGNGSAYNSQSDALIILKNGNTSIGHSSPTQMLDVNGNARFRSVGSGTFAYNLNLTSDGTLTTSTSDLSMKENIQQISNALDEVNRLRGVTFTWKSDSTGTSQIGMIAQEVEAIVPELVFTNQVDGLKGINYSQATALLVEAIKEQQQQIESYKSQLQSLQEEVAQIKALLTTFK